MFDDFRPWTDGDLASRFRHHPPKLDQAERYAAIREKILEVARFIRDRTPHCQDQELAFVALDEAMFRANAAIARCE